MRKQKQFDAKNIIEKFNKSKLGDFFSDVLRIEQDIGMGAFRNANIGFKNGKIFKKMK